MFKFKRVEFNPDDYITFLDEVYWSQVYEEIESIVEDRHGVDISYLDLESWHVDFNLIEPDKFIGENPILNDVHAHRKEFFIENLNKWKKEHDQHEDELMALYYEEEK